MPVPRSKERRVLRFDMYIAPSSPVAELWRAPCLGFCLMPTYLATRKSRGEGDRVDKQAATPHAMIDDDDAPISCAGVPSVCFGTFALNPLGAPHIFI